MNGLTIIYIKIIYHSHLNLNTQIENTFNKLGGIQEHIWGEMFIDMSHYFQNQKGSLIIMTISNLDEIDPETNKTPHQMNRTELIEKVKNILLNKLNTTIQPIKYNMYPSIKKLIINGLNLINHS